LAGEEKLKVAVPQRPQHQCHPARPWGWRRGLCRSQVAVAYGHANALDAV